jgi:hypothetical protein
MDFKKATDELFDCPTQNELAKILGISVASIRQARLQGSAKAHRSPPKNWEEAVIRMAEERVRSYRALVSKLSASRQKSLPHSGS